MTNLGDLEVFASVAASGSMSQAAKALGYSPAVISKRIKRLEEKLGARLFQRTTLGELASACAEHVTTMPQIEAAVTAYANGKPWQQGEERARLLEKLLPNERPSTEIVLDAIAGGFKV